MKSLAWKKLLSLTLAMFLLGLVSHVQAQSFTTFTRQQIGPQQYVAVPTYWQIRPNIFPSTGNYLQEYWQVGLRTRNGYTTRLYYVNNSREAMLQARREFPNASLIGIRKFQ